MKETLAFLGVAVVAAIVMHALSQGDRCNLPISCLSPNDIKQCLIGERK